jgi:hypothetical protein
MAFREKAVAAVERNPDRHRQRIGRQGRIPGRGAANRAGAGFGIHPGLPPPSDGQMGERLPQNSPFATRAPARVYAYTEAVLFKRSPLRIWSALKSTSASPQGRRGPFPRPLETPRRRRPARGAPPPRSRPSFVLDRSAPPSAEWSARKGRKLWPVWADSNRAEPGRRGPGLRSARAYCFLITGDHFGLTPFRSRVILKH